MSSKDPKVERKPRKSYTVSKHCLMLILIPQPTKQWDSDTDGVVRSPLLKTGRDLFKDFKRENKHSFWNKPLADSMKEISFMGFFEPYTLFIKGSGKSLDVVREAYGRRVLKPPRNFSIVQLGDVGGIEVTPVQQAQFIPLTEVLCLIISEMNKRKLMANQDSIRSKLGECYNKMPIPSPEIIHKSLTHLLNERKVEHSGQGYFIIGMENVSPDTEEETDDSGTEYSCRLKKPREDRGYLMYKDGQLTKHILPTFMVDKGTQTLVNKGQVNVHHVVRPMSFPTAANNPNKNPAGTGMQTIYEREPTSVGQSPEHSTSSLQRSLSMREKRSSPAKKNSFDRTSSMRVKMDIEPGYLTSDSDIKPSCFGKLLGKSPKKSAARAAERRANMNLQTFAAQFPPSDVHDPFFNYAHFEDKIEIPKVVAAGNGNGNGKFKERIIEGAGNTAVVKEKKKRDGPMPKDSKSRNTQQYKVDHGKLTHTAESLQQKYKNAAEESMPESEAEFVRPSFEGQFRTKAVADQAKPPKKKVLSVHSDKIKHYFSTLRDTKPQHVKPFEGITDGETDSLCTEQMSGLPPGLDLPQGGHVNSTKGLYQEEGQYCALPSESESESVGVPSMIRKFVATSRQINETYRKHPNPTAKQVRNPDNASSNGGGSSVRERPIGLSPNQPYPGQNNSMNGAKNHHNGSSSNGDFYQEGEIDDLMHREMNHNSSGHASSPNHVTSQRPFSAAYAELQFKNVGDSRLTHSNHNIQNCVPRDESAMSRYNQNQNGQSDRGSRSLPTTPLHEASPAMQVVAHQRIESLCSSTGDSGFNSPRSSVSQGHNNNNMAFDLINDRQNGLSEAKLKRHSLGNIVDNDNAFKMVKSPSSHSTQSTGSENTVKSQVERRKQRSNTNLNRIASLDVIGTL